jgi:hypothetical protein
MFSGQGAGGDATASAVFADLTRVARRLVLGEPAPTLAARVPGAQICPMEPPEMVG